MTDRTIDLDSRRGGQEIRAWQHRGGQLLDHEARGFGGGIESLILWTPLGRPAAAHEQLG